MTSQEKIFGTLTPSEAASRKAILDKERDTPAASANEILTYLLPDFDPSEFPPDMKLIAHKLVGARAQATPRLYVLLKQEAARVIEERRLARYKASLIKIDSPLE
jgi:hypothetical protein